MRRVSGVGRVAALGAVLVAVVLVALVLFGSTGDGGYTVKARFVNASQLVKGNLVQVGGQEAGTIDDIEITGDGQALVTMKVDERFEPLKRDTRASIRQASLSGIANRYVELQLGSADGDPIPSGGTIPADRTSAAVDLDQLFNTLDPPTRKALQGFFKGSARQFAGRGEQANRGLEYLNPALSTSSRLFSELNRDTPLLERFLVDSSRVVTALAERRDDLTNLVSNLNTTVRAVGSEKAELAEAIDRLPPFMRRANTTFVNLRAALDDVDPLVDAAKPVARRLGPLLDELRPFANDARPAVRDLSRIVRRRGADNDLIELVRSNSPLADVAVDTRELNGARREGAFPETARATRETAPIIARARPYTTDLFGWFNDFSNTGVYDALGGVARLQVTFNASNVNQFTQGLLDLPLQNPADLIGAERFKQLIETSQFKRCPGGAEPPASDGSNVLSPEEQEQLDCVSGQRAVAPHR